MHLTRWTSHYLTILISGLASTLLIWIGMWFHQQSTSALQASSYTVSGDRLKLVGGTGEINKDGLRILRHSSNISVTIMAVIPSLPAENYERVSWKIAGISENQKASLVWNTSLQPWQSQERQLSPEVLRQGYIQLDDEPAWAGRILQLGIRLKGDIEPPVLVENIAILRSAPGLLDALSTLSLDWNGREPWSGRSINFHIGTSPDHWITPVSALALWITISAGFIVLARRFFADTNFVHGLAFLFLFAWFLLDFRWQWQLGSRLEETYDRHLRLVKNNYLGGMLDEKIFLVAEEVRKALPPEPGRLIILSENPNDYSSGRIRYHLLPHRVFGSDRLPTQNQVLAGDHILLISGLKNIHYKTNKRVLVGPGASLAVEPLMVIKGVLALFRVTGIDR